MHKTFPILLTNITETLIGPRSIPWSVIEPFEDRAQRNHGQSLTVLSERGGLSTVEMVLVLTDQPYESPVNIDPQDALDQIVEIVESRQ